MVPGRCCPGQVTCSETAEVCQWGASIHHEHPLSEATLRQGELTCGLWGLMQGQEPSSPVMARAGKGWQ